MFDEFKVEVAQDVFIVGFPRGLAGSGLLPIWKRGSIASEPGVDYGGLPCLLIDSTTREGLSGSPVIAEFVGYHAKDRDRPSGDDWIGLGRSFLGVYSARLKGQDEFEAQLGVVWKAETVRDITATGRDRLGSRIGPGG